MRKPNIKHSLYCKNVFRKYWRESQVKEQQQRQAAELAKQQANPTATEPKTETNEPEEITPVDKLWEVVKWIVVIAILFAFVMAMMHFS